jgi:anti-sigma B factor antagonist
MAAADTGYPSRPADPFAAEPTTHGAAVVLAVSGTVDLATVPQLEQAIDAALAGASGFSGFVIDLTDVEFLASAGMAILVSTHQRLSASKSFAVVADGPATGRPLQLTGLGEVLSIHTTLPEALAAVE